MMLRKWICLKQACKIYIVNTYTKKKLLKLFLKSISNCCKKGSFQCIFDKKKNHLGHLNPKRDESTYQITLYYYKSETVIYLISGFHIIQTAISSIGIVKCEVWRRFCLTKYILYSMNNCSNTCRKDQFSISQTWYLQISQHSSCHFTKMIPWKYLLTLDSYERF